MHHYQTKQSVEGEDLRGMQQLTPQGQEPKHKRLTLVFWVAFAGVLAITLLLAGLIIWILKTQDFTKASSVVSLIASIVGAVSAPLILLFTITKWPQKHSTETQTHNPSRLSSAQSVAVPSV